jgi:hypothetical protein
MSSLELKAAKQRLIKAIARNKVKITQSNEYLKIQQGDRAVQILINNIDAPPHKFMTGACAFPRTPVRFLLLQIYRKCSLHSV